MIAQNAMVAGADSHTTAFSVHINVKLEDLKVLRRSPDLLNNVKIGQGQLQPIMEPICFTIYGDCRHFGQVTKTI